MMTVALLTAALAEDGGPSPAPRFTWSLERRSAEVEAACNIPVTVERTDATTEPTGSWSMPPCDVAAIEAAFDAYGGTDCTFVAVTIGDRVHVGPGTPDAEGSCTLRPTSLDAPFEVLAGERTLAEHTPRFNAAGFLMDTHLGPEWRTGRHEGATTVRQFLDAFLYEETDGRRTTWKVRSWGLSHLPSQPAFHVLLAHLGASRVGGATITGPYTYASRWWETDGARFQESTPEEKAQLAALDQAFAAGEVTIDDWRAQRKVLLARTRLRVGEEAPETPSDP